jgi:uncharacterized cofD-like protein
MSMNVKRIVVIGGGTGQATILRALKQIPHIDITAIVTVADDGGSTGRLRRAYHIPAMGDIRSVMIALAEDEGLFSKLMQYRFELDELVELSDEPNELLGHNLGNIILTALTKQTGSFMEAVSIISKVLNVKGNIFPSTHQVVRLIARMADGTLVQGESNIPKSRNRIEEIFYDVEVKASKEAQKAIQQADVIIYGIGSIYTSICPNLIIPEINKALQKSQALKIYCANAMTQAGETDGFSLEDHVRAIEKHAQSTIDVVLYAKDKLPEWVLNRYEQRDAKPVALSERKHSYRLIKRKLLRFDTGRVRHNVNRLHVVLKEILEGEA